MKVSFFYPDFARFFPHGNSVELPLNQTANGPERHIVEVVQTKHTCGHLCKSVRMYVWFFLRQSKSINGSGSVQVSQIGQNGSIIKGET